MPELIPDKNIDVNGKVIGANTTIKLSVKTALWVITGLFGVVIAILSYAYFDLKKDISSSQNDFVKKVDTSVDGMEDDIEEIRIDQAEIRGDIRLILDRQTRDNPIVANPTVEVESSTPPG